MPKFTVPISAIAAVVAALVVGGIVSVRAEGNPDSAHLESLDDLAARLATCESERCPHLVYFWSPSMPLSERGIEEIEQAAAELDVPVSIVPGESLQSETLSSMESAELRADLVRAGATVHFPSIVLFDGSDAVGNAIVGHKRASGYVALLESRLSEADVRANDDPAPIGLVLAANAPSAQVGSTATVDVLWTLPVRPTPGAFFRRVPETRYVAFDQQRNVILRDLDSDRQFIGPGFIDFVPTPDGRLFVTPSDRNGLEFYLAETVFARGRVGDGKRVEPVHNDIEMDDQYPSVGIMADVPGVRTDYRILISWFQGLAFRDYSVEWSEGGATVTATSPKIAACPGMGLSTPILSKDGFDIAARDESTGTTKVFRLRDDGSCEEQFDLGMQTSKVGFSDDGRLIAFSSPDPDARGRSTAYVYDRETEEVAEIPFTESRGLMIPEFVGPDSLLVLATSDEGPRAVEFRVLCCVR